LNSKSSCLCLQKAGITGVSYHALLRINFLIAALLDLKEAAL
jgi:hypothetical protein